MEFTNIEEELARGQIQDSFSCHENVIPIIGRCMMSSMIQLDAIQWNQLRKAYALRVSLLFVFVSKKKEGYESQIRLFFERKQFRGVGVICLSNLVHGILTSGTQYMVLDILYKVLGIPALGTWTLVPGTLIPVTKYMVFDTWYLSRVMAMVRKTLAASPRWQQHSAMW